MKNKENRKNGYESINQAVDEEESRPPKSVWSSIRVLITLIICVTIGPINFVLYKIMFAAFGERRAFFVSNCINLVYVIFGGIVLYIVDLQGKITPEMREIPHLKFMIMGLLDAIGGFLSAMGANRTSGSLQQLLNQTLIPVTMIASWIMLKKRSTLLQCIGASIIFFGAWIVVIPSFQTDNTNIVPAHQNYALISNFVYFCSNIPLACSCVYKEIGFQNLQVHVIYLTQWVSIYQLFFGLLLAPFQLIPGIGSLSGATLTDINKDFISGIYCYLHIDGLCSSHYTFFLLTGYCFVNFLFNTAGLYLVKQESAVLNSLTYALVLPLTVLAFNSPILGIYKEEFNYMTLLGLIVVLIGFIVWKVELVSPLEDDFNKTLMLKENSTDSESIPLNEGNVGYESDDEVGFYACSMGEREKKKKSDVAIPDAFYDRVIVLSLDNI